MKLGIPEMLSLLERQRSINLLELNLDGQEWEVLAMLLDSGVLQVIIIIIYMIIIKMIMIIINDNDNNNNSNNNNNDNNNLYFTRETQSNTGFDFRCGPHI